MRSANGRPLAAGCQPLTAILPDRLQHPEARLGRGTRQGLQQALVRERDDPIEQVDLRVGHNRRRRREREATGEDGEGAKEALLPRGQEVLAPGDGPAHCVLPGWAVASATGEQRQPLRQAGQQCRRRQDPNARGGELEGQRQPIESVADGGHVLDVGVAQGEVGLDGLGALDEEADGRRLGYTLQHGRLPRRRQRQRRDRVRVFDRQAQPFPACHQDREGRDGRRQVGNHEGGLHDLFEVVEHQQHAA